MTQTVNFFPNPALRGVLIPQDKVFKKALRGISPTPMADKVLAQMETNSSWQEGYVFVKIQISTLMKDSQRHPFSKIMDVLSTYSGFYSDVDKFARLLRASYKGQKEGEAVFLAMKPCYILLNGEEQGMVLILKRTLKGEDFLCSGPERDLGPNDWVVAAFKEEERKEGVIDSLFQLVG